jgi:processive 1,2-diacylglycerol beta-glucosyltransferase/1,2-diacylglycerol 3-beta-galactosyltransferase
VDFIYDLISISDVVLTKCGASTIMEILNLKKIPVVNVYIWEQELGNVDYLVEKKLGIYEPKIKRLPGVISNLLIDDEFYSLYRDNIENEKIENGLPAVSRHIIGSNAE